MLEPITYKDLYKEFSYWQDESKVNLALKNENTDCKISPNYAVSLTSCYLLFNFEYPPKTIQEYDLAKFNINKISIEIDRDAKLLVINKLLAIKYDN